MFFTLSSLLNTHPTFIEGTSISVVIVQCSSLLLSFAKKRLNSGSGHCQWVLIYGKHLKRLICLGYWRTKQLKCLVWTNEANANINSVESLQSW